MKHNNQFNLLFWSKFGQKVDTYIAQPCIYVWGTSRQHAWRKPDSMEIRRRIWGKVAVVTPRNKDRQTDTEVNIDRHILVEWVHGRREMKKGCNRP